MTQKILYEQANGKIGLMSWAPHLTAAQAADELPPNTEYMLINDVDLPSKEDLVDFFDAMRADFINNAITVDIQEARTITKDRLRRQRQAKFEENDIKLRDAMLENDAEKLAEAIAERNRLRDLPLLADFKNTLAELRNLHP